MALITKKGLCGLTYKACSNIPVFSQKDICARSQNPKTPSLSIIPSDFSSSGYQLRYSDGSGMLIKKRDNAELPFITIEMPKSIGDCLIFRRADLLKFYCNLRCQYIRFVIGFIFVTAVFQCQGRSFKNPDTYSPNVTFLRQIFLGVF